MKYKVGQKLECTKESTSFDGNKEIFTKGNLYEVIGTFENGDISIYDNDGVYRQLNDVSAEFHFGGNKQKSKHTPEQQAYLDQCAIAAMQGICVNTGRNGHSFNDPSTIVNTAQDLAEAMFAERERRAKG